MRPTGSSYLGALRVTLRQTAAAYGYALTISTTSALLASVRGPAGPQDLLLFALGGLAGFAALDGVLELSRSSASESPETAFPFAGALNFLSVLAGFGAADGVAHLVHSSLAWLLAPLVATAIYLAIVALQVAGVDAVRGSSTRRGPSQPPHGD